MQQPVRVSAVPNVRARLARAVREAPADTRAVCAGALRASRRPRVRHRCTSAGSAYSTDERWQS
eukprot:13588495-Alexandrium_andersonii.AAC.1